MLATDEGPRQQLRHVMLAPARLLLCVALAVFMFMASGFAQAQDARSWPVVRTGDRGVLALTVQRLLIHRGFDLVADADFGPRTAAAVQSLQQQHGIVVDGVVGEETWKELVVTLRLGATRSAAVQALQEQLFTTYGYRLAVDGVFGPETAAAVVDFQVLVGLQVDGIVGSQTWKAIVSPATMRALERYEPSPILATPMCQHVVSWTDLVDFHPVSDVLTELSQNSLVLQPVKDASGERLNLDFYGVRIDRLPAIDGVPATPESLMVYVRRNWGAFYDQKIATFSPYVDDDNRFSQGDPLGAVLHIDMLMGLGIVGLDNPDDGTVVVGDASSSSWRFSTVWSPHDGYHPVSGTREFGIVENADATYTVYTRGADRPTTWIDDMLSRVIFSKADELWRSFQQSIAAFVNANGGTAELEAPTFSQYSWEDVRNCFAVN